MVRRTKPPIRIPDAINKSITKNFTQVPNNILRNPELSAKAKTILFILLSNKEGWVTYQTTLQSMMKEGETAIANGVAELRQAGCLMKLRYRDIQTKQIKGAFWAYTDIPYEFDSMQDTIEILADKGLELLPGDFERQTNIPKNHPPGNPPDGTQGDGNHGLIIYNNNKTNKIISISSEAAKQTGKITHSMFEEFWKIYPRKDSKGKAKTIWNKLCNKLTKDRPEWEEIKSAIEEQKKSQRWQDKQFIPLPTTWLNQERWIDDPKEMNSFSHPNTTPGKPDKVPPKKQIKQAVPDKEVQTWLDIYEAAKAVLSNPNNGQLPDLAANIVRMRQQILDARRPFTGRRDTYYQQFPHWIVERYSDWLQNRDWLKDKKPNLFDTNHKLFREQFLPAYAQDNDDFDPITGQYFEG